jgi:modulator of FtsH protease HflK
MKGLQSMAWQDNNGGGDRGPWGQGPRNTGGGGQQPPNLDEMLKKGQDQFKSMMPGKLGGSTGIAIIALILLGLWAATGTFRVQPAEKGVVLVFGEWDGQLLGEGLHWNWPAPIGEYATPQVTERRITQVGFVTNSRGGDSTFENEVIQESLMLTGDENIIDIDFQVFWDIKNAGFYLFEIQNPEETVKDVAESVMREVVGRTTLTDALTSGRSLIEVTSLELMQEVLDSYSSGIHVQDVKLKKADTPPEVIDEFRDVQAAGADQQALINQAEANANKILPEARGQAAIIFQEAAAHKARVVARAQGEAARFISVYDEYSQAEDVTRKRMYLETMEGIYAKVNKIIIDGEAGSGVVPYLPLPEVQKRSGGK